MGGLIQGAKDKIWSIANQMVATKPAPEIRFGLIGYRDRSDDYVTKVHNLTDDIDAIYGRLMEFTAGGGGDGPESVNQALHEAVTKMDWSTDRDVLKIIFLVGDAPPHMDYQDDVKYPEVCQAAMKKDLIINTIQCGTMGGTEKIWRDIADKAEGRYAAILQDGGTVAIATPFDDEIGELSRALGRTVIAYGERQDREKVDAKLSVARAAPAEAAADRAEFFASSAPARPGVSAPVVSGDGDLTALVEKGGLKVEEVDEDKLPEPLKALTIEERKEAVEAKLAERKKLSGRMDELVRKRGAFIERERKRLAAEGKADGFDSEVKAMVREQAKAKGIKYGD